MAHRPARGPPDLGAAVAAALSLVAVATQILLEPVLGSPSRSSSTSRRRRRGVRRRPLDRAADGRPVLADACPALRGPGRDVVLRGPHRGVPARALRGGRRGDSLVTGATFAARRSALEAGTRSTFMRRNRRRAVTSRPEQRTQVLETAAALSDAVTPEEVADVVVRQAVLAIGASAGAVLTPRPTAPGCGRSARTVSRRATSRLPRRHRSTVERGLDGDRLGSAGVHPRPRGRRPALPDLREPVRRRVDRGVRGDPARARGGADRRPDPERSRASSRRSWS